MIKISIDVTLIDKNKLNEITRKSGEKAKFLELVLIETPNGKYGDYMVKQDSTKEERESGKQTPILGNGKNFSTRQPDGHSPTTAPSGDPEKDDVPF